MGKPMVVVYKGRLVYVCEEGTSVELECLGFHRQAGFSSEPVSKLTSKLHWNIEDVKPCTDDRTGLDTLFVLACCRSGSAAKRFCIIQADWRGSDVFSHISTSRSAHKSSFELMPFLEFKCTIDVSESSFCTLTYGPRAVLVGKNRIWLFGRKAKELNIVQSSGFTILDDESDIAQSTTSSPSNDSQGHNQMESKILSVISEHDWIVGLLLISKKRCTSVVAISLERNAESGEFERKSLCTRDFLPQEYVSKVSTVTIQACRRTVGADHSYVYENLCAVGLNDGYVMLFDNGMLQTCVTPWVHIGAVYPAFAVTEVLSLNDILICHTNTKDCFVINSGMSKVMHHWDSVHRSLSGDFLHCGRQQLLLLFDDSLPKPLPAAYLLTDLQGFVFDRREGDGEKLSQNETQEEDKPGNLHGVTAALWQQNQALARNVTEEEQRLASKQLFLQETWRCLQHLSLDGPDAVPDILPPEVPLVPLLGVDRPVGDHWTRSSVTDSHKNIKVLSTWHRILDCVCVVGVKVINTSSREMKNCIMSLTTPSESLSSPSHHHLSAHTKVWQCFSAGTSASAASTEPLLPDADLRKRQKVEPQVHVCQTEVIQPLESVTLTCTFTVPNLGVCGEVEYVVHLHFLVQGLTTSCTPCLDKGCLTIGLKQGGGGDPREAGRDMAPRGLQAEGRIKCVSCGTVTVRAATILQQSEQLSNGIEGLENIPGDDGDTKFEENLLALSSIQRRWSLDIGFVLHEATMLPKCLQNAGFLFHGRLGQYVASQAAPGCLRWMRLQLLGFQPLPERTATVWVFARDSNQLLLLLRHLYAHLPDDAAITLATEQRDLHVKHLMKLISAELCEKKKQARAVVAAGKVGIPPTGLPQPGTALELGAVSTEDSNGSSPEVTKRESEEFAERQRLYRHSRTQHVGREAVAKFEAAVQNCETETDTVVAKFKL